MTVRTVIVDDEPPARRHLIRLLDDVERIEIVGEAETGPNAVEVIRTQRPNLVLLDIEMPGMNGLEVVEAIGPDRMPNTIFVTAYDEYAVKAFEVRALDYLMKPVTKDRLGKALDRLFALADSEADRARKLLTILDHIRPPPRYLERLVCTKGDRAFLVPVADITHIVAAGNYVEAFTATGSHLIRETLQRIETGLDPDRFVRIHRSTIVCLDAVTEIRGLAHGDATVHLGTQVRLRVSRRYRSALLKCTT